MKKTLFIVVSLFLIVSMLTACAPKAAEIPAAEDAAC